MNITLVEKVKIHMVKIHILFRVWQVFPNIGLLVQRHPDTKTLIAVKTISYQRWIGQLYRSSQLFSVRQPAPVPWSQEMKGKMWFSGCRARYERGKYEFQKIAVNEEIKFISKNIQPYLDANEVAEQVDIVEPLEGKQL